MLGAQREALVRLREGLETAEPSGRRDEFRTTLNRVLANREPNPVREYAELRRPLQDYCSELRRSNPRQREVAIIDTSVFIDADKNPDGASREFLDWGSDDYELLTTEGVAAELRVGAMAVPTNVKLVPEAPLTAMIVDAGIEVGTRRNKAISRVDLGAVATALAWNPTARVVTHDADFWAVRDLLLVRGGPEFYVVRPC